MKALPLAYMIVGIQTYPVLGGMVTALMFASKKKNTRLNFKAFLVMRYIRIVPLFAFAILMHATWLYHLGSGPFWDRVNFSERQFCRENWWSNLLFINNYHSENKCILPTRYLAVDFWAGAVAVLLLIWTEANLKLRRIALAVVVGLSAIVNGITVFALKSEPIAFYFAE